MLIHTADGKLIHTQPMILFNDIYPFCNTHRADFQLAFYNYAVSKGINVCFGERITEFFEDDERAGIISNGKRVLGDVVIGADGVHSPARNFVTGTIDKPVSSGFAIYRAWFPLDLLSNNALTESFVQGGDSMNAWIGADVHCFVTVNKSLDSISYVLTHKDDYTVEESWSFPGRVEDILKVVEGWDPVLLAVLAATPSDRLIDWKLLWRDPLKKWVSQNGRIALSGDAAHPFLPSSGNGASQAIEDSATIATALRLAGKHNVKIALKAYETLRYDPID
jgi:2-polyprenyl-6-methoxyphenol hydroxylase-like FAD-dependent oxidoreductase